MTTREKFEKKLNSLNNDQIIELIDTTWEDATGCFFREIGFDIIEERMGEEESDRIYDELWYKHHAA